MASTWGLSWGTSWGTSWNRGAAPPTPPQSSGGAWMPFYVGKKKARRKAKQLIEHIREAFERLEQQAEQGIDEDVLIIRADVIKTDIVRAAQTVDQYPELLQQLNTIRAQLQAYIDEINDDDDELLLLLW